jgi:hypothetical protein
MYQLTMFKNQYDNKTHRVLSFPAWDQFEKYFYKLATVKGKKGGPDSSPLISPAVYSSGTTRSNKNVVLWASWCAVDVDDFIFDLASRSLEEELYDRFGHFYYLCYSTASSRESHPKFRLVFPLACQVPAERIKHFWWSLNSELGAMGDKQTKDLSRMFYVPADYPNAYNFIFTNTGTFIDPDQLMARWPYSEKTGDSFLDRLPDAWKEQIIEHRKSQLDNTNIYWTGYTDCPFWPKKLSMEYRMINGSGWYRKMYQIMVATAGNAIKKGYPITAKQIAELCKQFDQDTGNWYDNRPMEIEADRALEYVYRNG